MFVEDPEPSEHLCDGRTALTSGEQQDGFRLAGEGELADVYRVDTSAPGGGDGAKLRTWQAVEGLISYKIADNPVYSAAVAEAAADAAKTTAHLQRAAAPVRSDNHRAPR